MSAKEMFEKLGYRLNEKPRFGAIVDYILYCKDGCCRLNDLLFYPSKNIQCDEEYISLELLQAINQQVKELGW